MSTVALLNPRLLPNTIVGTAGLSWIERAALALGIWEIPLQLDKYLMFRPSDSDLGAVAGANISFTTFALVLLYTLWVMQTVVRRSRERQAAIMGFPMLLYMSCIALSTLSAAVPVLALFDLLLVVQAYALFFYLANRVRARSDIVYCVYVLVAALLTQSLLVFWLAALGESGLGQRFDFGPLALLVWEDGRVAGSLLSPVVCGSVMAFLWLPAVALVLIIKSRRGWWLAALSALAGLLAVILTQSRGAIISMVIGALIVGGAMFVRGWLPRWTMWAVLVAVALSTYPLATVVRDRVFGDDNGSAESRMHLSLIALEMIRDRPLFGFGAGNCHLAAQSYADQSIYRAEWYYTIHSKYLLTWVETGLCGFISFLFVLGNALRYGIRAWASQDRLLAALGLACLASLVGSMVHMSVDIFNSRAQVQLLWAVIGIVAAVYRLACLTTSCVGSPDSSGALPSDRPIRKGILSADGIV